MTPGPAGDSGRSGPERHRARTDDRRRPGPGLRGGGAHLLAGPLRPLGHRRRPHNQLTAPPPPPSRPRRPPHRAASLTPAPRGLTLFVLVTESAPPARIRCPEREKAAGQAVASAGQASGGGGFEEASSQVAGAALEVVAADGHASDDVRAGGPHDVAQLVECLARLEGERDEGGRLLAAAWPASRSFSRPARPGRWPKKNIPSVQAPTTTRSASLSACRSTAVMAQTVVGSAPARQLPADDLGRPLGVAGQALVDDHGAHGTVSTTRLRRRAA